MQVAIAQYFATPLVRTDFTGLIRPRGLHHFFSELTGREVRNSLGVTCASVHLRLMNITRFIDVQQAAEVWHAFSLHSLVHCPSL